MVSQNEIMSLSCFRLVASVQCRSSFRKIGRSFSVLLLCKGRHGVSNNFFALWERRPQCVHTIHTRPRKDFPCCFRKWKSITLCELPMCACSLRAAVALRHAICAGRGSRLPLPSLNFFLSMRGWHSFQWRNRAPSAARVRLVAAFGTYPWLHAGHIQSARFRSTSISCRTSTDAGFLRVRRACISGCIFRI